MKKIMGAFCIVTASVLVLSGAIISTRQAMPKAFAVATPCGEINTDNVGGGGGNNDGTGGDNTEIPGQSDGNGGLYANDSVDVAVVDYTPGLVIVGQKQWTTSENTVQLDINYKAMTCLEIYDNGVLIATIPVTPSYDWQNIKYLVGLKTVGTHDITVKGFDLLGNSSVTDLDYVVIYDPKYTPPSAGVIKIGEVTVAKADLVTIVSSVILACGVFALLIVISNKKQEKKLRRQR
ncbi:MAG: hypothetical protein LBM97_01090 [Candidatus Nomurabacteria bacterium]|jgi:hypothetical protein|nr:hypothetical protein [Candidatus Nomurabacteria bacterium]